MGVNPKIGGKPPKWMVKIMGFTIFLETPMCSKLVMSRWKLGSMVRINGVRYSLGL